ncbi:MAG TPA: ABC transporter ATP-binding protein, partial [Cytophagales bacterium]|nr:ABC transporter ATP-binding protein [Cytophagales bacterium]
MLEAQNLTKQYGDFTALEGLNLQVNPGDIYCLLGANGAGKTTTINLFMGFIAPTSGQVKVNGIAVTTASDATKKHLAYIPENL